MWRYKAGDTLFTISCPQLWIYELSLNIQVFE